MKWSGPEPNPAIRKRDRIIAALLRGLTATAEQLKKRQQADGKLEEDIRRLVARAESDWERERWG